MVLGIIVMVGLLGFFSCKRHNIDSIAAKHVSTSFRFVCICALSLFAVAFAVRASYLGKRTPQKSDNFHHYLHGIYFAFAC